MYSIGVIGDYDSICGFSAIGFETMAVETVDEARDALQSLVNREFGIIYITEPFMEELIEDCVRFDDQTTPCILSIPAYTGITGFGTSRLKDYVEWAVGSDILFGDE